jgi:hypothetical protein
MRYCWIWIVAFVAVASQVSAAEPEPGRTDGPEGSEYGKGGYPFYRETGEFYLDGYVGSATVDIEFKDNLTPNFSQTDIVYGISAGYQVEDWLGFGLGFGHITEQKINLYSAGVLASYNLEPLNYFLSLDAEIFNPETGSSKFGFAPGVGAEVVLTDYLRAGLRFQHDFIFADDTISINRFTARLQLRF